MSISCGEPYREWGEYDIHLEDFEDECAKWWDRLLPINKYYFFPWATGSNFGTTKEMLRLPEYDRLKFDELDEDIREQIVEKYAVQKELVKPVGELPDWRNSIFYDDDTKRILEK